MKNYKASWKSLKLRTMRIGNVKIWGRNWNRKSLFGS